MTGLRARMAGETDLRRLADMRWRLKTDDEPRFDQTAYDAFVREFVAAHHDRRLSNLKHWVVETKSEVIGAMSVVLVDKVPAPGELAAQWGYLTNSYVYPEARSSGAGSFLLEAIKAWAKDVKLELLLVWPSERAYPFYERAGFQSQRDPLMLELAVG